MDKKIRQGEAIVGASTAAGSRKKKTTSLYKEAHVLINQGQDRLVHMPGMM